jgi:hypothetical protein
MADYFTQTVIQPTIPIADITPLEHLLVSNIFQLRDPWRGAVFLRRGKPAVLVTLASAPGVHIVLFIR